MLGPRTKVLLIPLLLLLLWVLLVNIQLRGVTPLPGPAGNIKLSFKLSQFLC
jgi:hypothetical protein